MKVHEWSKEKNEWLKKTRKVSFEDVVRAINEDRVFTIEKSRNRLHQFVYVVEIERYVFAVPFVIKEDATYFLKTIYPSRKLTKKNLSYI